MNITVEDINETRKNALVTVPAATIADIEKDLLKQFSRMAKVPGFRPGKAPVAMVRQRFKKDMEEELNRKVLTSAYEEVSGKEDIKVYSVVSVDEVEISSSSDAEIKFVIDVRPEFELPEYKGIPVSVESDAVTEEDFTKSKNSLLSQRAEFSVAEKAAEKGDYVKLSYEGKIGDEAVADIAPEHPIYGKQPTTWEEAGAEDAPGVRAIIDGIVGMQKGDTKDVEETFGDDCPVEALRGKTVSYHLEVQEVREKKLPEINKEFLDTLGIESEEQLDERIRENLKQQKGQAVFNQKQQQIVDHIDQQVQIALPESAVESESQQILQSFMRDAMNRGATQEQFEERREELIQQADAAARRRVKLQFVLAKVSEKEEIKLENEDLNRQILHQAMTSRTKPEQIVKELQKDRDRLQALQREVLFNKTLAFLIEQATVAEVAAEPAQA